ncbi:MAG TPA: MarR family transcriptional regulator [Anaerolineales bacterium]|nr:MarR family transcriptional regulator [Anaerolineales bacterium]
MTDQVQFSKILRQWVDNSMSRSWWSGWRHFTRNTGLSMPQFSILMQVYYRGQCGISDIGEYSQITNAAASQLVDKLTQGGLLERTEDPNDRRVKQLTLTKKARALIDTGMNERYRWVDELSTRLNADQRRKFGEALTTMNEVIRDMDLDSAPKKR